MSEARFSENETQLSDTTYAELQEIAARYPQARSGLLPMLHLVQSAEGMITPEGIRACAEILDLTPAEVSGVATFYTMYKRRPVGDYHVGVCTNTLCAVMGGDLIFERLQEHLGVGNDETTEDGAITLEHVECNAACDYAPVMMVNWEFMDNQTPESATQLVDDLRAGKEVHSTRGPKLCTWREAERVLAGFPDGRADEGPSAGPASLVGVEIARTMKWTAPESDVGGFETGAGAPSSTADADTKVAATAASDTARASTADADTKVAATAASDTARASTTDADNKVAAAEAADTARAESETKAETNDGEGK